MDEGKVTAKKGQSLHLSPNTVMIHVNRTAHSGRKGDLGRKLFNSVKIPKVSTLLYVDMPIVTSPNTILTQSFNRSWN